MEGGSEETAVPLSGSAAEEVGAGVNGSVIAHFATKTPLHTTKTPATHQPRIFKGRVLRL